MGEAKRRKQLDPNFGKVRKPKIRIRLLPQKISDIPVELAKLVREESPCLLFSLDYTKYSQQFDKLLFVVISKLAFETAHKTCLTWHYTVHEMGILGIDLSGGIRYDYDIYKHLIEKEIDRVISLKSPFLQYKTIDDVYESFRQEGCLVEYFLYIESLFILCQSVQSESRDLTPQHLHGGIFNCLSNQDRVNSDRVHSFILSYSSTKISLV